MSVLIAVSMAAVPLLLGIDPGTTTSDFEEARDEAREYLVRNPRLAVDSLGALILDSEWLDEARAVAATSDSSADVELPVRMLARSQAKLDALIDAAYSERMGSDPAWRYGVLDARTPAANFFGHAFVHDAVAGVVLCLFVLLLAGAPLERSWGSGLFAVFSILAIPITAHGYLLFDSSIGIPWSGSAGLAGALLGAYFIRGLGGHFIVPGWVLLPVWLGVEALVVRHYSIDDLGSVPWASFCAAVGFGALIAGALRLIGVESAMDARAAKAAKSGPNPLVSRAARLRSDGDPYQAFDLIGAAWRENPTDREVAEAFFQIAAEVGQPEAAADAILPSLYEALRGGDTPRALEYWIPIATAEAEVDIEATASVRLGEALLDASHPKEAIFSLRRAIHAGVSSAHAIRIVNVARDLDEGLARQAAAIALSDASLDPRRRAELEAITVLPTEPEPAQNPSDAAPDTVHASDDSQLSRRVSAEHQAVEMTVFPDMADGDSASETVVSAGQPSSSAHEAQLMDQNLDPGALSAESLDADVSQAEETVNPVAEESGDVLSHWNDATRMDYVGSGSEIDGDFGADLGADLEMDSDLLGDGDLFSESMATSEPADLYDALDSETDTDLTPLIEASDELTSPYQTSAPADELTMLATPETASASTVANPSPRDLGGQATIANLEGPDPNATIIAPEFDPLEEKPAMDFAIGLASTDPIDRPMREVRAVDAVPLDQNEEWIEIEVDGRGKSKLPIARIETLVVAGISGLAPRPILLVDFVLNWSADRSEPLKVIRIRSDRFDPRPFAPSESSPLEALTAWVRDLQDRSRATCLPSRAILEGQFARYESVEAYESEVLMAMREV